jgi:hypothetical protein
VFSILEVDEMTVFELTLLGIVVIIIAAAGFWFTTVLDDNKVDLSFIDPDQPRDYVDRLNDGEKPIKVNLRDL